jgi:predicted MFS family arabinose efflux permease
MPGVASNRGRRITLFTLIIAGEAIFFLPFILARVFRPTMLGFFQISNTELGLWFSVYGLVAMVSYLLGGILADRFQSRHLMASALWLTSAGGALMAVGPSDRIMALLYGFWGFTTIGLFWAAMIRATRDWGGMDFQGRAFGWLEGGRGSVAAILGTIGLIMFSRDGDFRKVILLTSGITFLVGFMVRVFVPDDSYTGSRTASRDALREIKSLLRLRKVWLLSLIIICAYSGYKITDDFSLFAREVLGFSESNAAGIGTAALWLRAISAVLAGYLADRYRKADIIAVCFALSALAGLLIGFGLVDSVISLIFLNLILTAVGIYGIRALYFAVLKDAGIPYVLTGTAVGIVSFAGYTPEIFMGPWMGYLLDRSPGAEGHAHVFLLLAAFAALGFVAGLLFLKIQDHPDVAGGMS